MGKPAGFVCGETIANGGTCHRVFETETGLKRHITMSHSKSAIDYKKAFETLQTENQQLVWDNDKLGEQKVAYEALIDKLQEQVKRLTEENTQLRNELQNASDLLDANAKALAQAGEYNTQLTARIIELQDRLINLLDGDV